MNFILIKKLIQENCRYCNNNNRNSVKKQFFVYIVINFKHIIYTIYKIYIYKYIYKKKYLIQKIDEIL